MDSIIQILKAEQLLTLDFHPTKPTSRYFICKPLLADCMWFGNFFHPHRTSHVWLRAALSLRVPSSKTGPRIPWSGLQAVVRRVVLEPSSLRVALRLEKGFRGRLRERAKILRDTTEQNSLPFSFGTNLYLGIKGSIS